MALLTVARKSSRSALPILGSQVVIHQGHGINEGLVLLWGKLGDDDSGFPQIIHEIPVHLAVQGPLVDGRLFGRFGDHLLVRCGERGPRASCR